jgi:hypothetical protein
MDTGQTFFFKLFFSPKPGEFLFPDPGKGFVSYISLGISLVIDSLAPHHLTIRHYSTAGQTCATEKWIANWLIAKAADIGTGFAKTYGKLSGSM